MLHSNTLNIFNYIILYSTTWKRGAGETGKLDHAMACHGHNCQGSVQFSTCHSEGWARQRFVHLDLTLPQNPQRNTYLILPQFRFYRHSHSHCCYFAVDHYIVWKILEAWQLAEIPSGSWAHHLLFILSATKSLTFSDHILSSPFIPGPSHFAQRICHSVPCWQMARTWKSEWKHAGKWKLKYPTWHRKSNCTSVKFQVVQPLVHWVWRYDWSSSSSKATLCTLLWKDIRISGFRRSISSNSGFVHGGLRTK